MRENRMSGSEGGGANQSSLPTPIIFRAFSVKIIRAARSMRTGRPRSQQNPPANAGGTDLMGGREQCERRVAT